MIPFDPRPIDLIISHKELDRGKIFLEMGALVLMPPQSICIVMANELLICTEVRPSVSQFILILAQIMKTWLSKKYSIMLISL